MFRWSRLLSESESSSANDLRCQVAAAHCLKRANQPESIVMAIEYRAILGQDLFKTVFDLLLSYREGILFFLCVCTY